jgi:hypothetical protein
MPDALMNLYALLTGNTRYDIKRVGKGNYYTATDLQTKQTAIFEIKKDGTCVNIALFGAVTLMSVRE